MIKLHKQKHKVEFSNTKLLLQVHDELIFETSESKLENIKYLISKIMITAHEPLVKLDVPIVVSQGNGTNWEEAH